MATGGRYRVTFLGFEVLSATWDHALWVDGKGDEIYLSAGIVQSDGLGNVVVNSEIRSRVFGDVNGYPGRIRAGSMSARGGIQSGDAFPGWDPKSLQAFGSPGTPPFPIWEGDLIEGDKSSVVISPTLWEWDGGADAFADWAGWAKSALPDAALAVASVLGAPAVGEVVREASTLGLGLALSMSEAGIMGQAKDRPIGIRRKPGGGPNDYAFDPKVVVFDFVHAEGALNANILGVPGLISVPYTDDARFHGNYTMYLRVDRVGYPTIPATPVPIGSTAVLRHAATRHRLHSHPFYYGHPGSSGQQQVTAFAGADGNDYWKVMTGHGAPMRRGVVKDGDVIRLMHVATGRNLHSHGGFPSPVTGQQEVTCFGSSGVGDGNDDWRVEVEGGGQWLSGSRVRLVHVATAAALHSHYGFSHPAWTRGQQEVTGFSARDDNDWWLVESIT